MNSAATRPLHHHDPSAVRYAIPRALAQLDPDRHQVVEASAGTGKTYLIEHRVVDILLSTDTFIEQILVVTFTEKATAELRFRVRRLIETVLHAREHTADIDEPHWIIDDEARRRLRDALLGFDRAAIHTIHAFCQRVLTENAFANRRLFAQTQVASDEAFGEAFMAALRQEFAREEHKRPYLEAWFRSGRTIEDLEDLLFRCASQHGRLVPEFDPEALAGALDRLVFRMPRIDDESRLEDFLRKGKVHGGSIKALIPRLIALRGILNNWTLSRDLPSFLVEFERMDRALRTSGKRLLPYLVHKLDDPEVLSRAPELKTVRDVLVELARSLVPLAAAVAQRFLPSVLVRLEAEKSRRGQFDFHDMLRLVWDSMKGEAGAEVVERLRTRYRHALIDEFQDTDELQWKIFRQLYLEAPDTGDEDPGTGNRLCIIGDPKQAIYSFRGADVYTYLEARRQVKEQSGQLTNLIDNYRSTHDLVRAYNLIFEERFGDAFFTGDIRYDHPVRAATDLRAIQANGQPIVPIQLFHVTAPTEPKPGKLRAERLRQTLLGRMTAEIRRLLYDPRSQLRVGHPEGEVPIEAGDIFVLTRTTAESNEVAARLRQAGLPCAIYKQEGLFQTREAMEVRDLLAGIAEPRRRSARFQAWNTRFFGVTLSDLPHLGELPETHPLVARLYEWHALADKLAYEELFARIIDDSGIIERELFLETSERSLTNFLHIFELLLEEVMRSRCELHELVHRLQRWITETGKSQTDDRNVQRLESERSAVQIMTIHRSKGLEAKVVFIYGGFHGFGGDEVQVYHENGERLVHVGHMGNGVDGVVHRESESEDQRLLYVALTRAVARLYLPYVEAADYKMTGCYAHLVRRLGPIVRQVRSGDPDLSRLFAIEHLSPNPGVWAEAEARRPRIDEWEPPDELLDASTPSLDAYAQVCQERGGFVVTSYTNMKSLGSSRLPLAAVDFKADIATTSARLPEAALPGGAQSGVFLHNVLEHVPFASALGNISFDEWRSLPEIDRLFRHAMLRHNRDPQHLRYSQMAIFHCLTTPIAVGRRIVPGLASCERIMREVEFLYPIPTNPDKREALRLVAEHESIRLERGFIKGFIDLVFEFQGRVYLVDWKSDILPDYGGKTLARHVFHEYQVQAELYSLALARMLELASEKQHKRRFGGLLFCFIRGMGAAPDSEGRQPGVFSIRPSYQTLIELEAALEERDDYR